MSKPIDPILEAHNDLVIVHNEWAKRVAALSPASPDYRERLSEDWHRRGLGEKWRRLEELVTRP